MPSARENPRRAPASVDTFPITPSAGRALDDPFAVAALVRARDPVTGLHLGRVGEIAHLFARSLGLAAPEAARIALGGYLHDIGKIDVPDAILKKSSRLTAKEMAVMQGHPETGVRLIGDHPIRPLVRAAVLYHHETPDGSGYPFGLRGDQIPFDAKLIGIVDAFDAMTSDRPYRSGMPVGRALAVIEERRGRQFDGDLGDAFVPFVHGGGLDVLASAIPRSPPVRTCPACGPMMYIPWGSGVPSAICCARCGLEAGTNG